MRSIDRIECHVNAGAASPSHRELTHRINEVTSSIVDCGSTKSLNYGEVRCRASTDCLEAKVTRKIEQRCADRPRRADHEDRLARQKATITRQHLEGCEVGERDANGLCRIDASRNKHKKTGGPDGILRIATD